MPFSVRALAATGAAALALAAAAPAAHAEVRYVYSAWFGASFAYATSEATESGRVTRRIKATLALTGWFDDLRIVNGMLATQRLARPSLVTAGAGELHFVNADVDPVDTSDCTGAPRAELPGMLNPMMALSPSAPPLPFGITPVSLVSYDLRCGENGGLLLGIGARSHRPGDLGPDHLRAELTIPRDKLGDEEIELRFSRVWRSVPRCPGDSVEGQLRSCVTNMSGTVRLYRTYRDPAPDDDLLAPLTPTRPKLDRDAARARASVRCPRGCRYRIRTFLPPRHGRGVLGTSSSASARPRASAAAAPLASRAGRLPAGKAAREISVAIPAAKRAAVVAAGGALVAIELDPPRGETLRATFFARAAG
jgi:hypothetical protein